jgi:two-component system cell cycle sensor histidine kinase/response regulator CckA
MISLRRLLHGKESNVDSFIAHCPIPLVEIDANLTIHNTNAAFTRMIKSPTTQSTFTSFLSSSDQESFRSIVQKAYSSQGTDHHTSCILHINPHTEINVTINIQSMPHRAGTRLFLFIHDVTEQKNLELRFAHSQKMQAVGQLAGGIAHDFNNLLTAMIGFCDLLLMRHPAGDPSFADIIQIKQNANRAANLVRQLLAFSRRQTLQPKRLDLVDVMSELSNLIRRLIGENIELVMHHQRDLWPIKADQGQLEQVLINLAVNARDAMKKGGTLTLNTRNVQLNKQHPLDKTLHVPPQEDIAADGDYVVISITDTGTGIPESVIDNIFEPFFSTKEIGSGTGLGLSTVYGIIKQTGGYVYLTTQENVGTVFHLYIPRLLEIEEISKSGDTAIAQDAQDLTGAATILLVEDETPVRIFAARALQNKGYTVLEADCAENGLEIYASHKDKIEVIVSDVVMPGMNGPTMVETLDERFPSEMQAVEVVFISGYAEDAFAGGVSGKREFHFLAKPFTLKQLAAKLKEVTSK